MNPQINHITKVLCDNGYKVHIVGGAVRDILLGKEPSDYDLVTSATPHQIIPLFPNEKVDLVGQSFNVLIIRNIEVASYRIDQYTDAFELINCNQAITLEEDLSRRDFTINALAMCASGDIIDLFNGREDLEFKIIKFVGNPADRIKEDPCRILRAFRFMAKIEGVINYFSHKAIEDNINLVNKIAKERIRLEILKVMECKKPSLFFDSLEFYYILKNIFPSLQDCYGLDGGEYHNETIYEHNMLVGDSIHPKLPLLRIAGYLHDVGKIRHEIIDGKLTFHEHEKHSVDLIKPELENLKFSTDEIHYICSIISLHMRMIRGASPKAIRRLLADLVKVNISYEDLIRLRIADRKGNKLKVPHSISEIKEMINAFRNEFKREQKVAFDLKSLEINGKDIMDILDIKPSRMVGDILDCLFEMVFEYPEYNTKGKLIEIVEEME